METNEGAVRHARMKEGEVYLNRSGSEYRCLRAVDADTYRMRSVGRYGWTFNAHVVTMYADGTIEWDYSTEGRFEEEK